MNHQTGDEVIVQSEKLGRLITVMSSEKLPDAQVQRTLKLTQSDNFARMRIMSTGNTLEVLWSRI